MKNRNNQRREKGRRLAERDRWLLSLDQERRELWNQLWERPLRELEEPYQKGWERFFVLSAQAKRRQDAENLEKALSYVRNYQRCAVNPFRITHWRSRKTRPWEHRLSGMNARTFLSEKIPDEVAKHFRLRLREPVTRERVRELIRSGWGGRLWFRYPAFAESVVQPYWITHARIALPEVESRLSEIEGILLTDGNLHRLDHIKDIGNRRWFRGEEANASQKEKAAAEKEMDQAMREFNGRSGSRRRPVIFLN